ncbi:MAG TPA: hypothetical protein VIF09_05120 [Polyangiaceae bacterium]
MVITARVFRCSRIAPRVVALLAVAVGLLFARVARATPRPLPFTYTYDTLASGETEIEQYADLTPVKAIDAGSGKPIWYTATQFQTEFEHGISDRLELGLYVAYQPDPGSSYQGAAHLTEGTGFKERLRLRLGEAGQWPVDVALYGELVEYSDEFEIEAKVILEKRFGKLRVAANAWAELEFYYSHPEHDWILNPTVGATYEVTPAFHAGLEYWARLEFSDPPDNPRPFDAGPNHFLGPAMMFNLGRFWWSTGVYARLNDINRVAQPLDNSGPVWVRTVVGIEL